MTEKFIKVWADSPEWNSSYEKNDYGSLFYSLVRVNNPNVIVELGTKSGYSAFHMAKALDQGPCSGSWTVGQMLWCYDLWEKYPFSSCPHAEAQTNLAKHVQRGVIEAWQTDVFQAHERHADNSVDMLHVDLSNDGEILDRVEALWFPKVRRGGMILVEGGSFERDNVEWMVKHKKRSIRKWLKGPRIHSSMNFDYVTIEPFPSLTIIQL